MSLQSVRQFFAEHAPDIEIIELNQSTATVALAAAAHNVEPGQIAKTLSLKIKDKIVLIVARGDARLDNKKLKETFGAKARMLSSDEVVTWTGHPVYCDVSLRHYQEVLPAAGAIHSAVRIEPERMAQLTDATWVDVCL